MVDRHYLSNRAQRLHGNWEISNQQSQAAFGQVLKHNKLLHIVTAIIWDQIPRHEIFK